MHTAETPSPRGVSASFGEIPRIEDWRLLVEKSLNGRDAGSLRSRTRDGIPIEPLYERRRDCAPLIGRRAGPWVLVQPIDDPHPDRANERAIAAIAGGATGLALRFSTASSEGGPGLPPTFEALAAALDGIDLATFHLRLESHQHGLQAAAWLRDLIGTSGLAAERADVAFGLDPVAFVASPTATDPEPFAAAFLALRDAHFRGPLALLDARTFHEKGATEAQELAAVLGAAAWWLRTLHDAGVAPETALSYIGASISVDRDVLVSIAKLRALRLLWARLQQVCGAAGIALQIHAETSRRMLTRSELLDNLLRNTLAAFAAGVGGADAVSVIPHTAALGITDRNAHALARNLQHLLMEESHLHRVADPAAGSGAVEALTEALAERAWEEFRALEREGGLIDSLRQGLFQARIADAGRQSAAAAKGAAT